MGASREVSRDRSGAPGLRMKRPFFGWIVVGAASSVLALSYGVQFSFGVLIADIERETGWTRTETSLAYSVYVLSYSVLSYAAGSLTDRWGPRRVIAIGGIMLGVGYVGTGLASQLWQFHVGLGLLAAVGMSAAFVPCNVTVVRWFVRRRGRALSIASAGTSVGGLVAPPVAGALAAAHGWRTAYVVLGLVVGGWLVAASRLMVASPESRGLSADGDPPPPEPVALGLSGATVPAALRTPAFWLIGAMFSCSWIAVFVPLVHVAPFADSLGVSRGLAATAVSAIGLGGLAGRLATGAISDRVGRLPALTTVLVVQALAFAGFAASRAAAPVLAAALAFGLAYGGTTTLFPAVVGDRFGRAHAGAIVGLLFAGGGSVSALGPTIAGYLYDATNSYRLSFLLSGAANVVAVALVLVLALTVRRETRLQAADPAGTVAPSIR